MSLIKEEVVEVCRICEAMENLLDISTEEFKELNEKLHKIGQFEDQYTCWLKYICTTCSINLQNAFAFKSQCEFTYRKLIDQYESMNSKDLDLMKNVKQEEEEKSPEGFSTNQQKSMKLPNKEEVVQNNNSQRKPHRLYVCEYCDTIFNAKADLKDHINRIHLKNGQYTCETCGAKLKNNSGLIKHRQMHSGQKFSCDICGKNFTTEQYLKRHRKAHFEKRKPKAYVYLCHFCGQGASDLHYYEEHLRIHSGEKPFKCNKCDKSFAQMQGLRLHSLTHSDKRPHACSLCTSTFRKKSHLNSHIISHTGEKKHKCQACEKSFTKASGLKTHMRLHTGEQPYECCNCLMTFRLRKMLVSHKKKCQESCEIK